MLPNCQLWLSFEICELGNSKANRSHLRYYVNTANFYRQIRNVVIDVRKVAKGEVITCLHYQVAQATSLQNVELIAEPGSTQIGLFAENGSGGGIADVTFTGGGIGLKGGNQQFTAQRLTFNGCTVGIQVIWDWGWVWKSITMNNVKTAFQLVGDGGVGNSKSIYLPSMHAISSVEMRASGHSSSGGMGGCLDFQALLTSPTQSAQSLSWTLPLQMLALSSLSSQFQQLLVLAARASLLTTLPSQVFPLQSQIQQVLHYWQPHLTSISGLSDPSILEQPILALFQKEEKSALIEDIQHFWMQKEITLNVLDLNMKISTRLQSSILRILVAKVMARQMIQQLSRLLFTRLLVKFCMWMQDHIF